MPSIQSFGHDRIMSKIHSHNLNQLSMVSSALGSHNDKNNGLFSNPSCFLNLEESKTKVLDKKK